jgi:FdhD protein
MGRHESGGDEIVAAMLTEPKSLKYVELFEASGDRTTVETSAAIFRGSQAYRGADLLAVEEPMEIQLAYGPAGARRVKSISVTMRTPGHDFELAAGFLMSEGVVSDSDDITEISYRAGSSKPGEAAREGGGRMDALVLPYQPERNIVQVKLAPDVSVNMANLERNFYTTSSCGICGKASLLALRTVCPPRAQNGFQVAAQALYSLPARLRDAQKVFQRTGGLHAAGLFDSTGQLFSSREDVGRHNAVDKLLGAEFLADRTPLRDRLLLLSGRASFELLQKSLMGGIPMVVSVGAPSSLAVQVAREFDITLVGFLRADHFNVYNGAARVIGRSEITGE